MMVTLGIVFVIILVAVIFLIIISPGRVKPFTDESGNFSEKSISEKLFIEIGGVRQGMFIMGRDTNNPVLLFVHGGPSFSEFFLVDKYPTGIEDHFTVCYWDQRGGGLSCTPQVTPESMTLSQLASDAVEVTHYLRKRFNKEKIFMMAHSGGTAFALQAAAKNPELYRAYIGMAQITTQAESEKLAYKYMMDRYMATGNTKRISELGKFPLPDDDKYILPFFNSLIRDECMHELGIGTMHNMRSVIKDVFIPTWTCRGYTIKEKINIWRSKFSFMKKTGLRREVIGINIPDAVPRIDIPVYILGGKYDYTVNTDLSRQYLNMLIAPEKGFYTFDNSAHSPMFEEPGKLKEILVNDILKPAHFD